MKEPSSGFINTLIKFLDKNLNKFSPIVQNFIGITVLSVFAIVAVHVFIAPTYIRGKLFIKTGENETKRFANSHIVEYNNQAFVTNEYGNWILPVKGGFPRTIKIHLNDPAREYIDEFSTFGPWPFYNALYPMEYQITLHMYEEAEQKIEYETVVNSFDYTIPSLINKAYAEEHISISSNNHLSLVVHLQNIGDVACYDRSWCGTKGESRRLEGFSLKINKPIGDVRIKYMCHLEGIGDTQWYSEEEFCGTRGQSRRLEGFAIRLEGSDAHKYDILYQSHLEGIGDTKIVSNAEFIGTRGQSRRLEAIKIWLVKR